MKRWIMLGALIAFCGTARAGLPGDWCWWKQWYSPDCHAPGCCPNDYCPKKLPSAAPVKCGGPNDYCPKKLPSAVPVKCGGPNDYCPKSMPVVLPLVPGPWHTCGPPEQGECPRHP